MNRQEKRRRVFCFTEHDHIISKLSLSLFDDQRLPCATTDKYIKKKKKKVERFFHVIIDRVNLAQTNIYIDTLTHIYTYI